MSPVRSVTYVPGLYSWRSMKPPAQDRRQSGMMAHLLDALDRGEDIGHYGRLVFVMVARRFLSEEEVIQQLTKDPDCDEQKARALMKQLEARDYNPPLHLGVFASGHCGPWMDSLITGKRERILQWMNEQEFPICHNPEDQGACNVYKTLDFPPEVYEKISAFYQDGQR